MKNSATTLNVYYDRSCPICREEIEALKSVDEHDRLQLIDCSQAGFHDAHAAEAGIGQDSLKNAMHVRGEDGQWHVAADAFVAMYESVGLDAAAKLLKRPGVRSLFEWLYPFFVKHRYKLRFLGLHKIMPWLIKRAAAKQANKAQTCAVDRASKDNR